MVKRKTYLPDGSPRYIRCYDNGGSTADRYTVVFTGRCKHKSGGELMYLAMNDRPFHPQGFGQHGGMEQHFDVGKHGWPVAVGKECKSCPDIGKRIEFKDLPEDCRKLVLQDYVEMWGKP